MNPLHYGYTFWALLLQAISCGGYVAADYSRGFADVDSDATANDALYIILAWIGFFAALFFHFAAAKTPIYPHKASEALNLFTAALYCVSTATYLNAHTGDSKTFLVDFVVSVELFAAIAQLVSSFLYVYVWFVDRNAADTGSTGRPPKNGMSRFLVRLCEEWWTLEAQNQILNVAPSLIYIIAATIAAVAHFTIYRNNTNASSSSSSTATTSNSGYFTSPKIQKGSGFTALRDASQIYVAGDVLFFIDTLIAIVAGYRQRQKEGLEVANQVRRHSDASEEEEICRTRLLLLNQYESGASDGGGSITSDKAAGKTIN